MIHDVYMSHLGSISISIPFVKLLPHLQSSLTKVKVRIIQRELLKEIMDKKEKVRFRIKALVLNVRNDWLLTMVHS
jgi:hypothetical protein